MRLGCTGCLGSILVIGLTMAVLGGGVVLGVRLLALPDTEEPRTSAAEGSRAQQKLLALARRDRRAGAVTLTEGEVNSLLDRHVVEAGGTRLSGLAVHLPGQNRVDLRARTTLGKVLDEAGLGGAATALPRRWQARPVLLRAVGQVRIDDTAPRQLRLDLDAFYLGTQALPPAVLRLLLDPATAALLRWRLPEHVERVTIDPGRVTIQTRP
jgi:hypothetical protein